MKLKRRQFLAMSSTLLGTSSFAFAESGKGEDSLFLSAASDKDDNHWVIGFRQHGAVVEEAFKYQLPARAHHIAVNEKLGMYVVIARRPGRYLWIGDLSTGGPLAEFSTPHESHLLGHGVFSRDGQLFYTTESAWQLLHEDSGRVVVWAVNREGDIVSMTRMAEYPSFGVGPHELLLKEDQSTLVVANGGIRTHPDKGREKLNIDTMQPSLVYLDAGTGELKEQHFLDEVWHQASIRHLDLNASGQVVMGMQYEGEPFDRVPLVALHRQGEELQTLWAPEQVQSRMTQYVGSVRFDESGRFFAASCPRGNMITFWDGTSGEMLHSIRSRDGCGVSADNAGFLFTAGTGRISYYDPAADSISELNTDATGKVFWDNHLSRLVI